MYVLTDTASKTLNGPISQYDSLRVPCPIVRKLDNNGRAIATGEWKPGFEWIQDNDVICCELIHGVNLAIDIINEPGTEDGLLPIYDMKVYTRHNLLNPISDNQLIADIGEELKLAYPRNTIPSGRYFGIAIQNGRNHNYHVVCLRDTCVKNAYTNWGKEPKTVSNISTWIKEDLESRALMYIDERSRFYVYRGYPTHTKQKKGSNCEQRPYGLMFIHPDGRVARIRAMDFAWYWEEYAKHNNRKNKKNRNKIHMTKDTWNNLTPEQQAQIRANKHNT